MAQGNELNLVYAHHEPSDKDKVLHSGIRNAAHMFADAVLSMTTTSREQSLALTKIEEAMFWANAAVSRNER